MMFLSCLCPTYGRPQFLPEAMESFLRQSYPADRCELVILDDAGQYGSCDRRIDGRLIRIISIPDRYPNLGAKRNACAACADLRSDAFVMWDDDDIYLPWTLQAHAEALPHAYWSHPSAVYREPRDHRGPLSVVPVTTNHYHAAWAIRRGVFERANGYPEMITGEDQGLGRRLLDLHVRIADPLEHAPRPYFIRRRGTLHDWWASARTTRERWDDIAVHARLDPVDGSAIEPFWRREYDQLEVL